MQEKETGKKEKEEIYLSLVSDEGYQQLKSIRMKSGRIERERDIEGLVDRLNKAISELDSKGKWIAENTLYGDKIKIRYEDISSIFHQGEKPLLKAKGEWGIQTAGGEPTDEFALLYLVEIDYDTQALSLEFKPEKVKPYLPFSKDEFKKLKEDWELLTGVSRQVHAILSEYAHSRELIYSSPFKFPIVPPEGQEALPGFAEGREEKKKDKSTTIEWKNFDDPPF